MMDKPQIHMDIGLHAWQAPKVGRSQMGNLNIEGFDEDGHTYHLFFHERSAEHEFATSVMRAVLAEPCTHAELLAEWEEIITHAEVAEIEQAEAEDQVNTEAEADALARDLQNPAKLRAEADLADAIADEAEAKSNGEAEEAARCAGACDQHHEQPEAVAAEEAKA